MANVRKRRKKKNEHKALRLTFITLLMVFLFSCVAAAGVGLAMIKAAPPLDVDKVLNPSEPSVIYDDKDKLVDTVISDTYRTIVSYEDVPDNLKNAFISIEDERFFNHRGIDYKRVFGAFFRNISNKLKGKSALQGASTITQQLVRNTLLSQEVRIKRKVQEMYLSIQLEKKVSKEQILEAYMNTIPLGGSAYGIEAASKQYFGKSVKDLNLIESAFIAGLPQSPSTFYNAAMSQKNTERYINRTKLVLGKMREHNYISKEDFDKSMAYIDKNKIPLKTSNINISRLNYEWFSREIIKQVKKDLMNEYKISPTEADKTIMYGGLKIYGTMDKSLQDFSQNTLDNLDGILGVNSKDYSGIIQPEASVSIVDYKTGNVKVLIGGRGKQPPLSFNRATEFYRAPGSTIKPLTVYGPIIDTKMATAASSYNDAPVPEEIGELYPDSGKPYNPKNSPNIYEGKMTLREALMKSKNVISVRIEHELGLKTGAEYGKKFGLTIDDSMDGTSMAALSLGQLSAKTGVSGTNTLGMAAAYGVFGNKGALSKPVVYKKVVDRTGKVLLENKYASSKVMSPEAAYILYDLLKGPVSYTPGATGMKANFGPMARGKTGTSNQSSDLWFAGLSPYYSAAVWIGKDDYSPFTNEFGRYIGSSDAALIWKLIMGEAHKNLEYKTIEKPAGVTEAYVCSKSGKIPSSSCPRDSIKLEYFIEGTIPGEICDYHTGIFNNNKDKDDDDKDKDKEDEEENKDEKNEDKKEAKDNTKNKDKDKKKDNDRKIDIDKKPDSSKRKRKMIKPQI